MRFLQIICFLLAQLHILGQNLEEPTIEQLCSSHSHIDSTADAELLFSKCHVEYSVRPLEVKRYYQFQYKIYNSDGEKYAKFEIPFSIVSGQQEVVSNIKAITYNLNASGTIEEIKLSKKDIYREKTTENYHHFKFAIPNVKPGSILNVRYTVQSPGMYSLPKWEFQHYIPVKYSEYVLQVSEFIGMTPIATGLFPLEFTNRKLNLYDQNEIKIIARGVKPIKDDNYVLDIDDYRSSIRYEVHSMSFPGEFLKEYSKSWETLGDNLLANPNFGKQIKKKISDLSPIVKEALALDEVERVQFLYDYVRSNYVSEESYGIRSVRGLKKVVENKKGTHGELNLLLINLLRKADVFVLPLATRLRRHGMLNPHYPTLRNLNYLLVYVELSDGEVLIMDASSKYHPMKTLPLVGLNLSGLLIEAKSSSIIDIQNPNKYKASEFVTYEFSEDLLSLEGKGSKRLAGIAAIKYCRNLDELDDEDNQNIYTEEEDDESENDETDDEDLEEELEYEDSSEIVAAENVEDIYSPINLETENILYECINHIDDEIYLSADLGYGIQSNPWVEEERALPIFLNYRTSLKKVYNIKLPEGLELKEKPEDLSLSLPDKKARFRYFTTCFNNELKINYSFDINLPVFLHTDYPLLKEFFDLVIEKQNEKIVLKRT